MGMTSELNQGKARTLLTRGALIAACGFVAAGCGSAAAPSSTAPSGTAHGGSTSPAGTTSAAKVSLNVALTGGAGSAPKHWTLRCEPAGGNYPDPSTACTKLLKTKNLFNPYRLHVMCPMIMADARTYTVTGTFLGKNVHESIVDGGCDLTRWGELNQVFN